MSDMSTHPEDTAELPRRPRRRLLAPVPVTLLAVLLSACGFIAGVQVEKGQQSPGAGTGAGTGAGAGGARAAAGFAALRGARGGGSGGGSGGATGAGATIGQVANIDGRTLYVTNTQGNTVKVTVPAGLKVSKTVSASARTIHPGETVVIQGNATSGGGIEARTISIGAAAGLGALFGGSRAGGGGSATGSSAAGGSAGGGKPTVLFGG